MTSKKRRIFCIAMLIILLLCIVAIIIIDRGEHYGKSYFTAKAAIKITIILVDIICIIFGLTESIRKKQGYSAVFFLFISAFSLSYEAMPYFKDLYQGEVVYEANIFDISPIQDPDKPKKIGLHYDGYVFLQISDEAYEKIISQAPLDTSRTVFFEKIASKEYPHKHPIRIYFYKNTGIFDRVEILDK
ncbi:MAG: hypothetical protein IKR76_07590 [Ruminococcus sp.]|nr:hypothetical protein [Ruminococcus sp.]